MNEFICPKGIDILNEHLTTNRPMVLLAYQKDYNRLKELINAYQFAYNQISRTDKEDNVLLIFANGTQASQKRLLKFVNEFVDEPDKNVIITVSTDKQVWIDPSPEPLVIKKDMSSIVKLLYSLVFGVEVEMDDLLIRGNSYPRHPGLRSAMRGVYVREHEKHPSVWLEQSDRLVREKLAREAAEIEERKRKSWEIQAQKHKEEKLRKMLADSKNTVV